MGASSITIQSGPLPSPYATLSILVSPAPPHSLSEQKGRWQLTPATGERGEEEKATRERGGKQGDFTVSSVKISWHSATVHLLYTQSSLKVFWVPPPCTFSWALSLTLFRDI